MGRVIQHLLLDRSTSQPLWSDHDAVASLCRQRGSRLVERFSARFVLLVLLCYKRRAQQKGQCGSWVRRKRAILIRRVATEAGLCRSARTRRTARLEVKRKLRGA